MRSKIFMLSMFFAFFGYQSGIAVPINCGHGGTRINAECSTPTSRYSESKYQQVRRLFKPKGTSAMRRSSSNSPASITTSDFYSHLNVGNQRSLQYAEGTIPMDIGAIDIQGTSPQTWVLPDLSSLEITFQQNGSHIAVSDGYAYKEFPEATHALTWQGVPGVEFYQITDGLDLFFLGYTENILQPEPKVTDYYSTLSPVPLDLGDGFTGIITFIYEGNSELDSIEYHQFYDVIGYGTLQTTNQGSDNALKLIFTEKEYNYKNGVITDSTIVNEIVWYSKKGLYVRAGIDNPWESEGNVNLNYIEYQWLTSEVPLAPENLTATAQSASSVLLNWADKSVNESSFEIIRSKAATENADGTFSTIDATFTAPANTTTYTDNTNVDPGTTYYYKVRAKKN